MPKEAARRTKIVCTLGPSVQSYERLRELVRAGMDVARLNLSHGDLDLHARFIEWTRRAEEQEGRPIAVLADLAGPKIRTGNLAEGKITLERGATFILTTRDVPGDLEAVSVTYDRLPKEVEEGQSIMLADGTMELKVESVDQADVTCRVVTGGILTPHKGVNLPQTRLSVPALTEKDKTDLAWAVAQGVDLIALSFVRTAEHLEDTRRRIEKHGGRQPLIAKIEKQEALDRLEEILAASDGAMVARGDLGVETPLSRVPLVQKRILRRLRSLGKPSITATQMLKSMVDAPRPTRAEVADIANAILDGTDAVMLSEETASGEYPVEAVRVMDRVARETETEAGGTFPGVEHESRDPQRVAHAISDSAVHTALEVSAAAIVTPTVTGQSARFVARLRPQVPIVALSPDEAVLRQLTLTWGVIPRRMRQMRDLDSMVEHASTLLKEMGVAQDGDRFILTAGYPFEGVPTNLMVVSTIGGKNPTETRKERD